MDLEDFKDELSNIIDGEFQIKKGKNGKLVIHTNLIIIEDEVVNADEQEVEDSEEFDCEGGEFEDEDEDDEEDEDS